LFVDRRGGFMVRSLPLLILAAVSMTACASKPVRTSRVLSEPGAATIPACATERPTRPDEAVEKQLYGSVLVGYVIEMDGRVTDVTLEDPKASTILFGAVREWLYDCRATGRVPARRRIVELFTFSPWDTPPPNEPIVALEGETGITPPKKDERCQPDRPPPALLVRGTMTIEYEVHSNGQVGEVSLEKSEVPPALIRTVRSWLRSCPFEPAKRAGKPLAVKLRQTVAFDVN
jgi:TonB family protein